MVRVVRDEVSVNASRGGGGCGRIHERVQAKEDPGAELSAFITRRRLAEAA